MASSSRDVSMGNNTPDLVSSNKRQHDKDSVDVFRAKLTHQWFDPKRYRDPLTKGSARPSSSAPGVTPDMEKKWLAAIEASKASS